LHGRRLDQIVTESAKELAMRFVARAMGISVLLAHAPSFAQTPEPAACTATAAQLAANKKLVLDFFASNLPLKARAEQFLTEDYVQHNPRLLRLDEVLGTEGREAWYRGIEEAERRGIPIAELGGIRLTDPIIVMAECDLVTAVYKGVLSDPDRPGHTYEAFAFEVFRARDGKLAEHWDPVRLMPGCGSCRAG
jgi:predicted SnoaL-like aldol condensation-catalyzing enzyme